MLNCGGKRNFHDTHTLLRVSVEGFAPAYTEVVMKLTVSRSMRIDVLVLECRVEGRIMRVTTCQVIFYEEGSNHILLLHENYVMDWGSILDSR